MRALDPLWFAKMISDAKSLRISDIHIDVRAWEDKACSIVIRSFFAAREIFDRHRCRRSVDCITATNDGLPEKSPNPPRHVLSHVAPWKFVFELCSLAQECIGEFRSPGSGRPANCWSSAVRLGNEIPNGLHRIVGMHRHCCSADNPVLKLNLCTDDTWSSGLVSCSGWAILLHVSLVNGTRTPAR